MRIADEVRAVVARMDRVAAGPADGAAFGALVRAENAAAPPASIAALIGESAAAFAVDPALVRAVAENESGLDPRAISPAGARGIMQLMPATAQSLGVADADDPAANLRAGVRYLRGLLDRFGTIELAVAAYNAGPGAVARFGGVPPYRETQEYVRRVVRRYRELHDSATVLKAAMLR